MKYLFALALLVAAPVRAQARVEPIEITPFAGYLLGGNFLTFYSSPTTWSPGLHVSDHSTYGLRLGYNATARLEPEIQWSHTETSVTSHPPEALTVDFFVAGVNYNFSAGQFRPYVSVGLGAGLFDGLNYSQHTLFTTSFAVGGKYFFTPNLGLRLEARGYASKPDSIIKVSCGSCPNDWIFNGDFTGGIAVAF